GCDLMSLCLRPPRSGLSAAEFRLIYVNVGGRAIASAAVDLKAVIGEEGRDHQEDGNQRPYKKAFQGSLRSCCQDVASCNASEGSAKRARPSRHEGLRFSLPSRGEEKPRPFAADPRTRGCGAPWPNCDRPGRSKWQGRHLPYQCCRCRYGRGSSRSSAWR